MQSFIYISNFAKAKRRCAEVWLSMAQDVYVEENRSMKALGTQGEVSSVELMVPTTENGELEYENDLSDADFDIAVEIGPSFRSQRAAIVAALTSLISVTSDPQTQQVLQAMTIMNMEGEGLAPVREYFRKKLVDMGVLEPEERDEKRIEQAAESAKNDPNVLFLEAATQKALAEAADQREQVSKTAAETDLTMAKTLETMTKVDSTRTADTIAVLNVMAADQAADQAAQSAQQQQVPPSQ
jgi:hypothetical protein